jgi:tetratricopeptide (TPR) repeat protein
LARTKDLKGAILKYNNALALDENCVDALVARGAALANQDHLNEAIADLERAISIDPKHTNASKYLKKLLDTQQERKLKERLLKKSIVAGEFVLVRSELNR